MAMHSGWTSWASATISSWSLGRFVSVPPGLPIPRGIIFQSRDLLSGHTPYDLAKCSGEKRLWSRAASVCCLEQELSRENHISTGRKASPSWGWGAQKDPASGQSGSKKIFFSKLMGLRRSLGSQEPAKNRSPGRQREAVSSTLSKGLQPRVQKWIVVGWGWEVWHGTRTDRFFSQTISVF